MTNGSESKACNGLRRQVFSSGRYSGTYTFEYDVKLRKRGEHLCKPSPATDGRGSMDLLKLDSQVCAGRIVGHDALKGEAMVEWSDGAQSASFPRNTEAQATR
jgi:hypothetical protein